MTWYWSRLWYRWEFNISSIFHSFSSFITIDLENSFFWSNRESLMMRWKSSEWNTLCIHIMSDSFKHLVIQFFEESHCNDVSFIQKHLWFNLVINFLFMLISLIHHLFSCFDQSFTSKDQCLVYVIKYIFNVKKLMQIHFFRLVFNCSYELIDFQNDNSKDLNIWLFD